MTARCLFQKSAYSFLAKRTTEAFCVTVSFGVAFFDEKCRDLKISSNRPTMMNRLKLVSYDEFMAKCRQGSGSATLSYVAALHCCRAGFGESIASRASAASMYLWLMLAVLSPFLWHWGYALFFIWCLFGAFLLSRRLAQMAVLATLLGKGNMPYDIRKAMYAHLVAHDALVAREWPDR